MENPFTPGTHLTDLVSGRTIQILDSYPDGRYRVAGVKADGSLGPARRTSGTTFHATYLNTKGQPRRTGYVPAHLIPATAANPGPQPVRRTVPDMPDEIDFESMTDAELASFALRMQSIAAPYLEMLESAKEEQRRREPEPGLAVFGDVARVIKGASTQFNAIRAKETLPADLYRKICVPKPDPATARRILPPELYNKICTPKKMSVEVRFATDKDRAKHAEEQERKAIAAALQNLSAPEGEAPAAEAAFASQGIGDLVTAGGQGEPPF